MRFLRAVVVLLPVLAVCLAFMLPQRAEPLPLFARKFEMKCTQCHMAFPRLNAFGMAFRQNGYRLQGTTGESPWQSKEFPLSIVTNVGIQLTRANAFDSTAGARVKRTTSAFVQNAVELHSAGTLADRISFHVDNNFAAGDDVAGAGGPLESGMAFVQFDDLGQGGALNVKTGIYDMEIPYLSDSRRTTLAGYLSPVTLDGAGVELNGTATGWTYAAGIVNSSRAHGKSSARTLNNLENPYAWLMRDLGGQLVTGRVVVDRQDPRSLTKSASPHVQADLSTYLNGKRWALIPGFTYERFRDADPTLFDPADPANGARNTIETALLEGTVYVDPASRWLVTSRYELRHMPRFQTLAEEDDQQIVTDLDYYVNPNARIGLEWAHNADNVQGPRIDSGQLYVHFGY